MSALDDAKLQVNSLINFLLAPSDARKELLELLAVGPARMSMRAPGSEKVLTVHLELNAPKAESNV